MMIYMRDTVADCCSLLMDFNILESRGISGGLNFVSTSGFIHCATTARMSWYEIIRFTSAVHVPCYSAALQKNGNVSGDGAISDVRSVFQ